MFAMLSGKVIDKTQGKLVLDISGVGYEINVPLTYNASCGDNLSLFIKTIVREDDISLFGFQNKEEKEAFVLLKTVSGIGARTALAVISYYSVSDLSQIFISQNAKLLSRVPGIGLKTAQRMIVDLKEKFVNIGSPNISSLPQNQAYDDLLCALISLGFKQNQAEKALALKFDDINSGRALEDVLRETLQSLA